MLINDAAFTWTVKPNQTVIFCNKTAQTAFGVMQK